jgi:ribonuclease R
MNQRSLYEPEPGRHHGVGAAVYARFSSPMREVVGIFTHKEALELVDGPASARPAAKDIELRDRVVAAGNRSRDLQRSLEKEVVLLVLDELFAGELELAPGDRLPRTGTVLGLKPHLVYVQLDQPPVEVKIHLRDLAQLTGVAWRVDRHGVRVDPAPDCGFAAIRVGGPITLRLVGHDAKNRRWLLVPEAST